MTEQDFQAKLSELIQQIAQLPAPEKNELGKLADDARERQARMTKTLTELQESLDYLRLSVKYLVFDLEA
ncbi:MAG TPA: hypothetical protein VD963_07990, partial [Phycisphaerales bacterium]|nr:hypothetical protein [Phycisphaerales bacterium]